MRGAAAKIPCLLSLILAGAACAAAWAETPRQDGYRIGPRDLLGIQVFEAREFNTEARVSDEGTIRVPVLGEVTVQGLTDGELSALLKGLLEARYVQRATVVVQIKEHLSRPITVLGAVARPGPLSFSGRWTLLDALTAAGGVTPQHGDYIHVLRRADNGLSEQLAIRVADLLDRADRRVNIPIYPNDLINVPRYIEVTVFFLGEVRRPGAQTFRSTERITVLTAIAKAGGLTDRASRRILIKRGGDGDVPEQEIQVDYRRILSGRERDVELRDRDVVVVRESFF